MTTAQAKMMDKHQLPGNGRPGKPAVYKDIRHVDVPDLVPWTLTGEARAPMYFRTWQQAINFMLVYIYEEGVTSGAVPIPAG